MKPAIVMINIPATNGTVQLPRLRDRMSSAEPVTSKPLNSKKNAVIIGSNTRPTAENANK